MKAQQLKIGISGIVALMLSFQIFAQGNSWTPTKRIEIVVPAGPASALDQMARTIQQAMQKDGATKSLITIVNKAGGGQSIGFTYLNQSEPDGNTIGIGTISLITNRITGVSKLNYQNVTPIANMMGEYVVFAVGSESPLTDGNKLIEILKKDEKSISLAYSGSPGNHNHMAIGLVGKAGGVEVKKMKIVVFSSGGELAAALIGGHIDVAVGGSSVFASHVKAGRIKILAVTAPERLAGDMKSVPTWTELGLSVSFATFRGVVGPKNMAPASVRYWESELKKISGSDEWKKFLKARNSESMYLGSEDYKKFLDNENKRILGVLTDLGLAK